MERRQLVYLVAVVDDGSFTAAAERLHVAQPGLSAQVAKLERELGERLLDRDPRGVRPTPVGVEVVARAREVLHGFDEVRAAVGRSRGLLQGSVTIGTVRGVPLGSFATLLAAFADAHPAVDLALRESESTALHEALSAGTVEVALLGLAGADPAGLECRTVREDAVAVGVVTGDPWAGRRRIPVADLAERPLVTLVDGTGLRSCLALVCASAGVRPHIGFEAGTVGAVAELTRAGLGPAVLPAGAFDDGAPGADLAGVPLWPRATSRLAWARAAPARRTPSPAARALWAALEAPAPAGGLR